MEYAYAALLFATSTCSPQNNFLPSPPSPIFEVQLSYTIRLNTANVNLTISQIMCLQRVPNQSKTYRDSEMPCQISKCLKIMCISLHSSLMNKMYLSR